MRKKVDTNLPKDSSPKKREEVKETKGSVIKPSSDTNTRWDKVRILLCPTLISIIRNRIF